MGTFNTKQILYGSTSLIPTIAERIKEEFQVEDYEVNMDQLSSGGYDISITKGGFFKAILGMKSALKVTIRPKDSNIIFEAGAGIWGQQILPTAISVLVYTPVFLTQIWGLIGQAKLDDKALAIANKVIAENAPLKPAVPAEPEPSDVFCTSCGTKNPASAKFCCGCGKQL